MSSPWYMILFSYALCFLLATSSTASAAGPADPASGRHGILIANGHIPGWPTVYECGLEAGTLYSVSRSVLGLSFHPEGMVSVIYIGPVPRFKMLAFVLVLEKVSPYSPTEYTEEDMTKLFNGQMIPYFFRITNDNKNIKINLKWAQVAAAKELKRHNKPYLLHLTEDMLKIIKNNMEVNYKKRCEKGMSDWNWDWDAKSLGQQPIGTPGPTPVKPQKNQKKDRPQGRRK